MWNIFLGNILSTAVDNLWTVFFTCMEYQLSTGCDYVNVTEIYRKINTIYLIFIEKNNEKGRNSLEHLEQLWNNVLSQVEQKISKPSFETWLKSTKLLSYKGSNVTIAAPNSFARDWLENHYVHLITGILTELTGEDLLIKFVVQKDQDSDDFELPAPKIQAKATDHH